MTFSLSLYSGNKKLKIKSTISTPILIQKPTAKKSKIFKLSKPFCTTKELTIKLVEVPIKVIVPPTMEKYESGMSSLEGT